MDIETKEKLPDKLLENLNEGEQAKQIEGFEDYYITTGGKVWSNKSRFFLKPTQFSNGYLYVSLMREGKAIKWPIHRLVALAFIDNPENKATVNHLDEDKTNNKLNNLAWATIQENTNYGTHNQRVAESLKNNNSLSVYNPLSMPVYSIDPESGTMNIFSSIKEANKTFGVPNTKLIKAAAEDNEHKIKAFGRPWFWFDKDLIIPYYKIAEKYGENKNGR